MYQKHNIKSNKDFDSPPLLFSLDRSSFLCIMLRVIKKEENDQGVSDDFNYLIITKNIINCV